MGYGELDKKAINTIRVLAVRLIQAAQILFSPPALCNVHYPATKNLAPP